MKQGWIKLHRRLLDDEVWKELNSNQKVVMITILLKANHEEKIWNFNGETYAVNPGEFVTSLKSIAEEAGVTVDMVRHTIKKLEECWFLISESNNRNRKIKVINWEKYQKTDENPSTKLPKQNPKQFTIGKGNEEGSYNPLNTKGSELRSYGKETDLPKQNPKQFTENFPTNKKKELSNIYITGREQVEKYQNQLKEEAIKIMKANGRWEKLQEDINSDQTLNRNIKVELKPNSGVGEKQKEKEIKMSDKNPVTKTNWSTMPKKQAGESMADYLPRYNAWFNQCKKKTEEEHEESKDNVLGFRRRA